MKRNEIASVYADAAQLVGGELTGCGGVRTLRQSKNLAFIELNDGSCQRNLQVIVEQAKLANFDEICHQNVGAALVVKGQLILTPEAKQPCELHAVSV